MSERQDDYRTVPATPAYGTGGGVSMIQANMSNTDRIRWGPIWAGIFAAISTMILMGLLGLAIGLSAYDAAETTRGFGIGAGIWQILTVIVAFFAGGWVAGRASGFPGRNSGWLNGALVWAVSIPLALFLISGGVGAIMGGMSGLAQHVAPQQQRMGQPSYDAQPAGARMEDATQPLRDITSGQRRPTEDTIDRAQGIAWWTFASFALGLAAAAGGGAMGIRSRDDLTRDETGRSDRPKL